MMFPFANSEENKGGAFFFSKVFSFLNSASLYHSQKKRKDYDYIKNKSVFHGI